MKVVKHFLCILHLIRALLSGSTASTIYCTILWFAPRKVTRSLLGNIHKLGQQEQQIYGKKTYMCTSTAYEGSDALYVCMTLMWEPTQMGLQPYLLHYDVVNPNGEIKSLGDSEKLCWWGQQ